MYQTSVTIKVVLFSCFEHSVRVFVKEHDLPKGEPLKAESMDETVKRVVQEYSGIQITDEYIEQLFTYLTAVKEERLVTIVYYVLIPHLRLRDMSNVSWREISHIKISLPEKKIIDYALQRLQWKLEYTNVVYSLLSEQFTLRELQQIYEAILDRHLDKRNFRKKILSLRLLKQTQSVRKGEKSRPAKLYSFINRSPVITNIFS